MTLPPWVFWAGSRRVRIMGAVGVMVAVMVRVMDTIAVMGWVAVGVGVGITVGVVVWVWVAVCLPIALARAGRKDMKVEDEEHLRRCARTGATPSVLCLRAVLDEIDHLRERVAMLEAAPLAEFKQGGKP